jgi:hypothetical protein
MKAHGAGSVSLVVGLVLALSSVAGAVVDTTGVDGILKKSVLTPQDLAVIDPFVLDAVEDIVRTDDFAQIAATRAIIISRQGTQAQYAQQFSQSALKHVSDALRQAQAMPDPNRRFKVTTNLLILVDGLKDPRLVDISVGMIPSDNNGVRYWAVRAATDQTLWTKINQNQATASQLAERIIAACSRVVDTSSPEVVNLMADFAGRYNTPSAEDLLIRAADERIKSYAAWDPGYELADADILKLLANKLAGTAAPNPEIAKRFAQLYSFVIDRYIKGQQQNILSTASRNYLASVIVEVEDKCLSKLLGARQAALTKAVQDGNLDALQAERDKLLGTEGQPGTLFPKLKINYATSGPNRPTPLPLPLPDPPASVAPVAETPPVPQP